MSGKKQPFGVEKKAKLISAIGTLLNYLEETQGISKIDILSKVQESEQKDILIPLSIFREELAGLEAISKYMKENLNLSNMEISHILNRSNKTIWSAYSNAVEKRKKRFEAVDDEIFLPAGIFRKRHLSILETIVDFLKKRNLRNSQIAKILNKDQRTIWTVCSRIEKKMKKLKR